MLNRFCLILALLAGLYGLHEWDKVHAIHTAVNATETRLKASYDKALKDAENKALKDSVGMQIHSDFIRNTKDETIKTLSHQLDIAVSELRMRPKRPSPSSPPTDSPVVPACTAAELYQEDAEFLTREASRAESVLVERNYYYQQYEEVRNKLNGTPK